MKSEREKKYDEKCCVPDSFEYTKYSLLLHMEGQLPIGGAPSCFDPLWFIPATPPNSTAWCSLTFLGLSLAIRQPRKTERERGLPSLEPWGQTDRCSGQARTVATHPHYCTERLYATEALYARQRQTIIFCKFFCSTCCFCVVLGTLITKHIEFWS